MAMWGMPPQMDEESKKINPRDQGKHYYRIE